MLDPWYSLGTADMLDVAFMGLHVAQMSSPDDMRRCFDMVTNVNAAIMGLDHLGLEVGKTASLVILDAGDPDRGDPPARRAAMRYRQGQGGRGAREAPDTAFDRRPAGGGEPAAHGGRTVVRSVCDLAGYPTVLPLASNRYVRFGSGVA